MCLKNRWPSWQMPGGRRALMWWGLGNVSFFSSRNPDSGLSAPGSLCRQTARSPPHLLTGPQHASYSSLTLLCVCTCCPVSVAPPLALSPTRAGDLPIWVTAVSTVSSTQSEIQEVLNEHMNEFPKRDNLFFYTELQKGAAQIQAHCIFSAPLGTQGCCASCQMKGLW